MYQFRSFDFDLSVQCVLDHLIEAIALFHVGAGNTLVGVNLNELPFGMAFDVLCVVVDGSIVLHKAFGEGTVTKIDKAQKHIRVTFGIGEKTFIFPDAFKQGFLKMKGE